MGKTRVVTDIPLRDRQLIEYLAERGDTTVAGWTRKAILTTLYKQIKVDSELAEHDRKLSEMEREAVLHGR